MDEPQRGDGAQARALLKAAALGAVLAAAASAALLAESSLRALQLFATACLVLGAAIHGVRRGAGRTPGAVPAGRDHADLRALIATCAAGVTLWLLAPWTAAQHAREPGYPTPSGQRERAWLCSESLLATPYAALRDAARARTLVLAGGTRARMLEMCAHERSSGLIRSAEPNPAGRRVATNGPPTQSARSLLRGAAKTPYDLILTAPAPNRSAPLGVLPHAEAPLETVEGIRDLLGGLSAQGVLAATLLGEPATLRWITILRGALAGSDANAADRQLVIFGAGGAYTVLTRRTPFETDSLIALNVGQSRSPTPAPAGLRSAPAWLRARPRLQFTAGAAFDNRIADALRAEGNELSASYAFELRAPTDDWPFFFELTRSDRPDTWSSSTSFRVLSWSIPLAGILASVLALWVTRRAPARASERVRMIAGYAALALAHALAYGYAQQRAALWLPRALDAPAFTALALLGGGVAWFAFRDRNRQRARSAFDLLASLVAVALVAAVSAVAAPPLTLAQRWGAGALAWIAIAGLLALGGALASAAIVCVRRTPQLRREAAAIYVAALAPASLLGPAWALTYGYRHCAWAASAAIVCAIALVPRPRG